MEGEVSCKVSWRVGISECRKRMCREFVFSEPSNNRILYAYDGFDGILISMSGVCHLICIDCGLFQAEVF